MRDMKYIIMLFPIISLLSLLIRIEASMPWREFERLLSFRKEDREKEWGDLEKKEQRKKDYKKMLIYWFIINIVVFACYGFFCSKV